MSTAPTPPPEDPGGMGPGLRPGYTAMGNFSMARMPTPGNAEFLFLVIAFVLLGIFTVIFDSITMDDWFRYFLWVSVAYIISRGLAKATRVLEE